MDSCRQLVDVSEELENIGSLENFVDKLFF